MGDAAPRLTAIPEVGMAKKKAARVVGSVKAGSRVKGVSSRKWTILDANSGKTIGVPIASPAVKPKGVSVKSIRKAISSLKPQTLRQ